MKDDNKNNEIEPCTIHSVMPSYLQEVEKEAYMIIQKYGKKRAEEEAILTAKSYIEDINNLEYYDAEKNRFVGNITANIVVSGKILAHLRIIKTKYYDQKRFN